MHLGTLLAAVGGFLRAQAEDGEWQVRIDDIDPPRVAAGAVDGILRTLENFGLYWDGAVVYQSGRREHYDQALRALEARDAVYPCACSRREVEAVAKRGPNGAIYPGTCRAGLARGETAHAARLATRLAVRLKTPDTEVGFNDLCRGYYGLNLRRQVGDFVIRRADGYFAYHLATVADDALDGFTEIVRGRDLLSVTPQQIYLQQALGYATPAYAHLPLLKNANGEKLGKSAGATAVDEMDKHAALKIVFRALGIPIKDDIIAAEDETRWQWAAWHWDIAKAAGGDVGIEEIRCGE